MVHSTPGRAPGHGAGFSVTVPRSLAGKLTSSIQPTFCVLVETETLGYSRAQDNN